VLVATDGTEFQSLIGEVLASAGFELRTALSGDDAWETIGSWRPHVALLDVALPGVPAFELCDRVRADRGLCGTGLILIASVFQQTRYKRAPTSLYGADDYVEKHHIRDWLPGKVARLLPGGAVPAASVPAASTPAAPAPAPAPPVAAPAAAHAAGHRHGSVEARDQETLIREELYGSQGRGRPGLERLRESLKRYARIIISDIALYNQELVEQGIREGTFSELLKREIDEGHRLYLTRVPPSAGGMDHYHEAVREFIAKRTAAAGHGASRPPGGA
jgi:CheY-like chemotaxis protein